jgi:hypothetical protein
MKLSLTVSITTLVLVISLAVAFWNWHEPDKPLVVNNGVTTVLGGVSSSLTFDEGGPTIKNETQVPVFVTTTENDLILPDPEKFSESSKYLLILINSDQEESIELGYSNKWELMGSHTHIDPEKARLFMVESKDGNIVPL